MANPNFTPTYSTNDIWRDTDMTRCLTDDIDAIDAVHASLPSTYAAKNHTHTGYATAEDVTAVRDALSSKANVNHTHTEYASTSHNHDSSYYKKSDVDSKLGAKADASILTSHTGNADVRVTSAKKTNWDAAYTHWGEENGGDKIVTTTGTGGAYVASVDGITALTAGVSFVMIPNVTSTKVNPTINVNGLGAKNIRMKISNNTTATTTLSSSNMLVANKPVRVMYDGTQWVIDIVRPSVANLYGTLGVTQGGTGAATAAAARDNLDVYSKAEVVALIEQMISSK